VTAINSESGREDDEDAGLVVVELDVIDVAAEVPFDAEV
jgi:hypothetical protein